jgi:PAS domain S-box-containing protein
MPYTMKQRGAGDFRQTVQLLVAPGTATLNSRVLWFVLAFALASGGALAGVLLHMRAEALRGGERLTRALSHVIAEQITRSLQMVDERLQAASQELMSRRAERPVDESEGRAFLRRHLQDLPYVRAIWTLDEQGRIDLDSDVGNIGVLLADREYFQVYRQRPDTGFYIGTGVRSRSTGTWLISASVPLRDTAGQWRGVMVAAVEPPFFVSLWRELDLAHQGAVSLFHRNGQLLMRSPPDPQGLGLHYPSLTLFTRMLPQSPEGVFTGTSGIDEVPRIVAYRVLELYPQVVVVVGSAIEQVLAPWRRFAFLTGGVWLLAVAIAAALGRQLQRQFKRGRHLERRFRELAQAMPNIVFVTDPAGVVEFVNERWSEATGRPADEAVGRRWDELARSEDAHAAAQTLSASVAAGQPIEMELRLRYLDGTDRWQLVRALPNRNGAGQVVSWFGTSTDVHELKLAQEHQREQTAEIGRLNATLEERIAQRTHELQQREAALRLANEQLRAFSYSVSHDLQSPLHRISSFAQLLQRDPALDVPGSKSAHYVQRIAANVEQMVQMVQGLLALSRVTRAEVDLRPVDLSAMATEVLEQLQAGAPERAVRWRVQPALQAQADPRLMRSVLENMLGNAWKFTSRTPDAEIQVGRNAAGEFYVRDNGAGFDMAHAGKLFGTFERLHRQDEFPGSGIGLATVERAISRQGGRIRAQGEPGRGATFWFTLAQPGPSGATA